MVQGITRLLARLCNKGGLGVVEKVRKMENQKTIGYKVFNPDFTCKGFQYEEGKEYKHKGKIEICSSGFHFCLKAQDCFSYYDFDPKNIVCEVEALGKVEGHSDDSKVVTDCIKIIRRLTWDEVLRVANSGSHNTGHSNSGDSNSGDRNSGDRNSGNWNSGDRNSGDSNSGYRNSGAFCTDVNPVLYLFDKPCKMSVREWEKSRAVELMGSIDPTVWIPWSAMSEEERKASPKYEASEGYCKSIPIKEAWANAWGNWSDENKKVFTSLENFDPVKFKEITGIDVAQ